MEIENARIATEIRQRALHAVHAKLVECDADEAIALLVEAAMLKLLKDTEDRGLGTPKASLDLTSDNGTMTPKPALDVSKLSVEALAEIMRASDASRPIDD
jgi:hypothetical protein